MPPSSQSLGQDSKVSLVIVDDHPLFRNGLKQVIEANPQFQLLAESGDGQTALDQISRLKPVIAVVDIHLPDFGGLELVQKLRLRRLNCRVVILTMHKDEALFNRALNLGAVGYLLKESAVTEIADCLRAAARGEHYISPAISGFVARRHQRTTELMTVNPGLERLTTAERRIMKLIAENRTSKEIAAELFISLRTVETHRANICDKLGLEGNQPLLRFALEHHADLQL